jgi:hypothetical protein
VDALLISVFVVLVKRDCPAAARPKSQQGAGNTAIEDGLLGDDTYTGPRGFGQPLIGSPMHAVRLLRKRLQRVVAPAQPRLDHLRSAHGATYGNLPLRSE